MFISNKQNIIEIIKKLPEKPGVYQFYNHLGEILYIGKAKNLKKRVHSYFVHSDHSYKNEVLVKKIYDVKYILVDNESDALLLENNLIKEYQPRYNILLKDDKTYPWISIIKEKFPRVIQTRNYNIDGSEYFGPYTSGLMVKTLLDLIRQLFKLRTCKYNLSEDNIRKKRYKKCLEFYLGNCNGPCEGLQNEDEYIRDIRQIREILKGNFHQVVLHLNNLMQKYADNYLFEEAEVIKQKIGILEKFTSKSTIVNPKINNVDIFSIINDEKYAYINFIKVIQGAIIQSHNVEIVKKLQEESEDILNYVIYDLRERFNSDSKEVIIPFAISHSMKNVLFTVPLRGDKRKLLNLSERNAASFRKDRINIRESASHVRDESMLLSILQHDLRLKKIPTLIECFDNSNIQGNYPVSSCVVFHSGKPNKSEYRHYNIKTVKGQNDFASMEEILYRRYKRIIDEKDRLPDLIIIDGGKGQLRAALKSINKLELGNQVEIISIAKRLEEIYIPGDPVPLYLDKNSSSLKLIQRIRDEAHRFSITYHRKKRSDAMMKSFLFNIKGIGETTRVRILSNTSDINELKRMSLEELIKLGGTKAGRILYAYFRSEHQKR